MPQNFGIQFIRRPKEQETEWRAVVEHALVCRLSEISKSAVAKHVLQKNLVNLFEKGKSLAYFN